MRSVMGGQGPGARAALFLESVFVGGSGSRFAIVSGIMMFPFSSLSPWRVNHATRLGHILYEWRIGWVLHRLLALPCSQLWHLCPCLPMSAPAPTLVSCRGDPLGSQ